MNCHFIFQAFLGKFPTSATSVSQELLVRNILSHNAYTSIMYILLILLDYLAVILHLCLFVYVCAGCVGPHQSARRLRTLVSGETRVGRKQVKCIKSPVRTVCGSSCSTNAVRGDEQLDLDHYDIMKCHWPI